MRGEALLSSPRIRTAPQVPHLHSTVGLGVSSAGGAVGTVSTSGAGTTLSVLCGRAGIAATSSKFRTRRKFVPAVAQFTNGRCCLLLTLQQRALGRLSAHGGPWDAWGPVKARLARDGTR